VQALWHPVQDIGGLVHPAALLAGCRPHLAERLPEPEHAPRFREGRRGNRNLRRRCQAATLQIEQQITPRLRALANAIGEADKPLSCQPTFGLDSELILSFRQSRLATRCGTQLA
jgi:truncated hemoglobin YjbI